MRRLIDPTEHNERAANELLGVVSQREIVRSVGQLQRQDAQPSRNQLFIAQETLWFYRADPAASTTTTMLTAIPSAGGTLAAINRSHYVPSAGRILLLRLSASDDVTAGLIKPSLLIVDAAGGSTTLDFDGAQLEVTYPNSHAQKFDWPFAPQIPAESFLAARVTADGSYAPTTLDITLGLTVGYAEWI